MNQVDADGASPVGGVHSRRTVLRTMLVSGGVLAGWLVNPNAATATAFGRAENARQPGVRPEGLMGTARILSADGAVTLMPFGLGAVLRPQRTTVQPSTLRVQLEWDARLFGLNPEVIVRMPGGDPIATMVAHRNDHASNRSTLEVTVPCALERGKVYELVAGALSAPRYPDDLVPAPVPLKVDLVSGNSASADQTTLSTFEPSSSPPWGAALGVMWFESDGSPAYPSFITVSSVGPGDVPARSGVRFDVDSLAVGDVSVLGTYDSAGEEVAGRCRTSASEGRTVTTWTSARAIPAGQRVNLALGAVLRPSASGGGDKGGPLVQLFSAGRAASRQRLTGGESLVG